MHQLPPGFSDHERHRQLLAFADDVLRVCDQIGVAPLLDGGLAVAVHLQDGGLVVRDVDLNCHEDEFERLAKALTEAGIFVEVQAWQVLQARRGDLKVEFGASNVWLDGLSIVPELVQVGGRVLSMVDAASLVEQYRRGVAATDNDEEREKHAKNVAKLRLLEAGLAESGTAEEV